MLESGIIYKVMPLKVLKSFILVGGKMSKFENEVKILDVNPKAVEKRLQALGATLKSKAIQKLYVYDLLGLSSRYYDCLQGLKSCRYDYQYEVQREKLKAVLFEIDNLANEEVDDEKKKASHEEMKACYDAITASYDENSLVALLDKIPSNELLEVFSGQELVALVNRFNINEEKWIRLRETNGKATLTVKHILHPKTQDQSQKGFQQVLETEIPVESLEDTNAILQQLGFVGRNYQEKRRTAYMLDGIEVDIDEWPMLPAYVEIEHDSRTTIDKLVAILGLNGKEVVSCNTVAVYKKYGIDLHQYRTLSFAPEDEDIEKKGDKPDLEIG